MAKKSIRNLAQKILKEHASFESAIDIYAIAKSQRVEVKEEDFEDDVSGVLVVKNNHAVIGINRNHHPNRKRFSIAHELGHFLLHCKSNSNEDVFIDKKYTYFRNLNSSRGVDVREIEANSFAAEILMPKQLIQNFIRKFEFDLSLLDDDIDDLARKLGVSIEALTIRLLKLGMIEPY